MLLIRATAIKEKTMNCIEIKTKAIFQERKLTEYKTLSQMIQSHHLASIKLI